MSEACSAGKTSVPLTISEDSSVMNLPKKLYYEKRGKLLIKNLQNRHFEAYYCADRKAALEQALALIPDQASVGWGGAISAEQIGLLDAIRNGLYHAIDRDACVDQESREAAMRSCFNADVFISGANAISLDGQLVNIDGTGNRVAALVYGPKTVVIIAGMNKVMDTLEEAVHRARTIAAPMNQQRFMMDTPCSHTGICADCKSDGCICNQILVTRNCRPQGRIKLILVGEELGL